MSHFYTYIAMELANDRAREAAHDYRAAQLRHGLPARPSAVRHGLANGMAALSRGSAAVARRLDECVADDLGRSLAPSE
jgi:hypothetical protein